LLVSQKFVKCGFIQDAEILTLIEQDLERAIDISSPVFEELVRRSIEVKASVVAIDFREFR